MDAIGKMSELINEGKKEFSATEKKTAMIYIERLNEIKEFRSVIRGFLRNVSEFIPEKDKLQRRS